MTRRIYLDLDGVMADFDGAFPAVFGLDHRDMADDDMWLKINGHPSFFRDLPPMPGAVEFFRAVEHLNPIILTACPKSNYAHVATQKVEWVRTHLSAHVTVLPVLGGSNKPLFMHAKGDILIDDFRRNTDAWAAAGGFAILHRGFDGTAAALEQAIGPFTAEPAQPVEAVEEQALNAALVAYNIEMLNRETGTLAVPDAMRAALSAALAHPRPKGDVAGFDRTIETPRRKQAVEKLLELGWTYHHENGWTAPTGAVALISIFPSGDPVLQPVEGWEQLSLGNHLLYATTTVEQTGEVVEGRDVAFYLRWALGRIEEVGLTEFSINDQITYREAAAALTAQPRPVGLPDGPLTGKYGDVLVPFIALMERELHANAGKGDRPGWLSMSPETAVLEIHHHVAKLQKAVLNRDVNGVREYGADVANMSMMAVDVCGLLTATPEVPRA